MYHMKYARSRSHNAKIVYNKLVINGTQYSVEVAEDWNYHDVNNREETAMQLQRNKAGTRKTSERSPIHKNDQREEKLIKMATTTTTTIQIPKN